MRRYADTFFRHWLLAMVPIAVLPLGAFILARSSPASISVTANIWVNQATIGQISYVSSYSSPAENVATNLSQLLASGSFDARVAQHSPLYLQSLPPSSDPATVASADFGKNVLVAAVGPNTVSFTYTTKNWNAGLQVLQTIINEMPQQLRLLNSHQVVSLQQQLVPAQAHLSLVTQNLHAYLQAHNIAPVAVDVQQFSDPGLAQRYQAVQSAQSNVQSIQSQINQLGGQASATRLEVIDRPSATLVSRKKTYLLDGVIGLLLGLALGGGFIVLKTAGDRTLRWADELPELLGLPALTVVPYSRALAMQGARTSGVGRRVKPGRSGTGKGG